MNIFYIVGVVVVILVGSKASSQKDSVPVGTVASTVFSISIMALKSACAAGSAVPAPARLPG